MVSSVQMDAVMNDGYLSEIQMIIMIRSFDLASSKT